MKKYYSDNQLSLLLRKGVYPYDYVDSIKKLDETSLSPKEAFYSKLTGEGITDKNDKSSTQIIMRFRHVVND